MVPFHLPFKFIVMLQDYEAYSTIPIVVTQIWHYSQHQANLA